jgi:hypothetical protein
MGKSVGVSYNHYQFGTIVVAMFLPVIGLLMVLVAVLTQPVFLSMILVAFTLSFVLLLLAFCSLRVEVSREQLQLRFGLGLVRKTFEIREIVDAYPVRNKWYYGFGIRLTPHGWLYNISGLDAVEIVMGSKKVRIGTPEPELLTRALQRAIKAAH